MKFAVLLSIVILSVTSLFANTEPMSNIDSEKKIRVPWANATEVNMQEVFSKGSYSLWKCPSELIDNYPGEKITGISFNYFVYKNNKFHLTVNEMNKTSVFEFFTD